MRFSWTFHFFLKQGHIVLHQDVDGLRAEREKSVDEIFREVFSC